MSDKARKKAADIIIISALSLIIIFLLKKTFFIIFPVILGFIFSECIKTSFKKLLPVSCKVKKILVILMLLIFFSFLSLIIILLFDRISGFFSFISDFLSGNIQKIEHFFESAAHFAEEKAGKIMHRDMHSEMSKYFLSLLNGFLDSLLYAIPSLIRSIADFIPKIFISLIIFIFSAYYFSVDNEFMASVFGIKAEMRSKIINAKNKIFASAKKTIGAYLLLFGITFIQLIIGFFLLKIKNPFSLAMMISFVDMLPVLGVGAVLVPWAAILFITGNNILAFGILILWLIVFITRQLSEPKIVGRKLGIHPVITLLSVITGLWFFGIGGLIFLPLTISFILDFLKENPEK